ncbi:ATP/GTP-binding protein [Mycoplasmopsis californica]|uniref:tRNA threonylcarbamoyladenosine biosynthesis protein TsaE n=1 Tax=Mycoplasmopsis equigenitalium TaxID=114883 RepID=A0ABY5J457_9BACT|nr:tRNA (adenosine(37)-N6)-threonylcarbamoyltransferase complex ATPase subunit type 1 TsaE [Mycoplasmopsis equigenitalium]UUD36922.1 tRNA (adenosine(37)-N6)-threonylcarbamoyltransferase complex ATPase subunit type 1 TsaE [Mycoplasmopsis equigenitalium]VEU69783.1 ATP/GTP-binding protein [Mycoplasmopsis californica]
MHKFTLKLPLNENQKFVDFLQKSIKNVDYLFLIGELGTGKTTLVKLIGKLLGETKTVNSPSFNYIKIYDKFVHIDAYNLKNGIDDFEDFFDDKLIIVEWANLIDYKKYNKQLTIEIKYTKNEDEREYLFY